MEEQNKGLNIKMIDLWHIVKGSWIVLLAVLIVITSGTYIFMVATHEDEYTAEVKLWAPPTNGATSSEVNANQSLMDDYQILVKSDSIVEQVKSELDMPTKVSVLRDMLSISVKGRVMTLSITANKKDRAQEIAQAWGKVFCEAVNNVPHGEDTGDMITLWQNATLPTEPSNPVKPLYAFLIGVLATILVYVAYLIRFILDDKVTTPEDVEKYLGLNVLGAVPDKNALRRRRMKAD